MQNQTADGVKISEIETTGIDYLESEYVVGIHNHKEPFFITWFNKCFEQRVAM